MDESNYGDSLPSQSLIDSPTTSPLKVQMQRTSMMSRHEDSKGNTIITTDAFDPRLLPELAALSIPMKEVIQSENIRDLLGSVKKILRRILKCDKVNFLLLDKNMIKIFHKENGKTARKQHKGSNCFFDVVLPSEMSVANIAEWDFNFKFDHIAQVAHGKMLDGKYLIWPVNNFNNQSKKDLFIQIEFN